ncbi:MAG: hypothetical protein DSO07_02990 [Thermoproteota archaeon]|uniref:Uncharacterized protein n=1 Tax=Candidatus Methanodesulfokora washburnensis TaxID=2478471 RepID=A0A3R9RRZ1_9CREN|nr:hypothetical protein [Candidatus Methanodesulfokores washburnensis]RSN77217.1 hypothetical protein D6D85_02845 [Candidatus Methanodesulfokores washburnensis]TDA41739.1 MAG: hypothetical protein DSO07_02990 [Candidatus Korarchaeota archaeon]
MPTTVSFKEFVRDVREAGVDFYAPGIDNITYEVLSAEEIKAVELAIKMLANHARAIAPQIAVEIERQAPAVYKMAAVAKAKFPGMKNISFPATGTGSIGISPLFPQAIKYTGTPSPSLPAYTSYTSNTWDITFTANTAAYLFGDGTNWYKANPTDGQRALLVILQNGVLEIGSTPKITQMRIKTDKSQKYGMFGVSPLSTIPLESGKKIHIYPTPGVVPIFHDVGIMWSVLPARSGTSTMPLLGFVFAEGDFLADIKTI